MALSSEEARVLASLIEKSATVPDSYPLSLNALRLACNQSTNRHPVVAYEDRSVEAALMALKSIGLVRFVHPSHGGRTIRYRHVADERWHLDHDELAVLAILVLRGPQTAGELRARSGRLLGADNPTIEEILDALAARSPEPFAILLPRRPGERDARWAHLLCGEANDLDLDAAIAPEHARAAEPAPAMTATSSTTSTPPWAVDLADEVESLRRRLDRLEHLLGIDPEDPDSEHRSTRLSR